MRVALDTTNILGRGAVRDTCNLLADGIVQVLRKSWQPWRTDHRGKATAQGQEGIRAVPGASLPRESPPSSLSRTIGARQALLAGIAIDY